MISSRLWEENIRVNYSRNKTIFFENCLKLIRIPERKNRMANILFEMYLQGDGEILKKYMHLVDEEDAESLFYQSIKEDNMDAIKFFYEHLDFKDECVYMLALRGNMSDIIVLPDYELHLEKCSENLKDIIWNKKVDTLKFLVNAGMNFNKNEALINSCYRGAIDLIDLFVSLGADINCVNDKCMFDIARDGQGSIVKVLLDYGADVHYHNESLLWSAIEKERMYMIDILLDHGANANNIRCFSRILRDWDLDAIKKFVKYGAKIESYVNVMDHIILHQFCNLKKLLFFLNNGASISNNTIHVYFSTALKNDYVEYIPELLKRGVDLNAYPICQYSHKTMKEIISFGMWHEKFDPMAWISLLDERHEKYFLGDKDKDVLRIIRNKKRMYSWPNDLSLVFLDCQE